MKYIRTKDGLYTEEKYKVAKAFVSAFEEEQAKIMPTQKTNFNIINQADTIEELCDWFVLRKDGKIYQMYAKEEYAVADLGQYSLAFEWVYAIETDKGLIYVAKMNDKGELELL